MNRTRRYKRAGFAFVACGTIVCSIASPALCQEETVPAAQSEYVKTVPYTSENFRDPFEAYIKKEEVALPVTQLIAEENFVPPPVAVSGITWGSSFPQAIVNGKVVRAGDVIDDVQVISISKEGLVLSYKNQRFSLPAPGMSRGQQQSGQNMP